MYLSLMDSVTDVLVQGSSSGFVSFLQNTWDVVNGFIDEVYSGIMAIFSYIADFLPGLLSSSLTYFFGAIVVLWVVGFCRDLL